MFQHTAARRRLITAMGIVLTNGAVSTHSRPKAADAQAVSHKATNNVSTHSRPKAAEWRKPSFAFTQIGFNTQPPEGG